MQNISFLALKLRLEFEVTDRRMTYVKIYDGKYFN